MNKLFYKRKINHRFFACVFFILSGISFVAAQEWFVSAATDSTTRIENNLGYTCEIIHDLELTKEMLERITSSLSVIWAIPGLSGNQAVVQVEAEDVFRFLIYPETFIYRDTDFRSLLPSGMGFLYDSALFYDVTMKVGEYAPKVSGAYVSPVDMLEQLYLASVMPEQYLYDANLLERIDMLEQAVMALAQKGLFSKPEPVNESLVISVINLYNENPEITVKQAVSLLKEEGFAVSTSEVQAIFMVYFGKFE